VGLRVALVVERADSSRLEAWTSHEEVAHERAYRVGIVRFVEFIS
jgi:hypothetical protein